MIYKFFPFFLSVSFIFFFLLSLPKFCMGLTFAYAYNCNDLINKVDLTFCLDYLSFFFIFIVFLVTSLVLVYREFYMEHYNNKKFLRLTLLFFISIILLSFSGSFLSLIIGWDGLGVTSIFLIIFYPNKMTLFNSILTIFFNRLGDVILIAIICFYVVNPSLIFFLESFPRFFIFLLFLICSFTKRAQFPLSSWLPAAMSAPTPISAIVHSSTLVTAGIFLMGKLIFYMNFFNLSLALCFFSSLTFILGGLMAVLERDFKKIVAFSTMSQISMIIYFCSLLLLNFSMAHIVFHAFFKTLLFCCSGIYFATKFRDQLRFKFYSNRNLTLLRVLFFFSIFRIRGFPFSCSFLTKDLVLEILLAENLNSKFILLLLGRFFTVVYCRKLMYSTKKFFFPFYSNLTKDYKMIFLIIFSLFSFFSGKILRNRIKIEFWPLLQVWWVVLILMALSSGFFFFVNINKVLAFISMEISFIKFITYTFLGNLITRNSLNKISFRDHFFFKPRKINLNLVKFTNIHKMAKRFYFFLTTLIFLLILSN